MANTVFWAVVLAACAAAEAATAALVSVWFVAGALAALLISPFGAPLHLQAAVFLLVSAALLVLVRPLAGKYFNGSREKTNIDCLPGSKALVLEEIDNILEKGAVRFNGQVWSARSHDDTVTIPAGAVVLVQKISGVRLIVREIKIYPAESAEEGES